MTHKAVIVVLGSTGFLLLLLQGWQFASTVGILRWSGGGGWPSVWDHETCLEYLWRDDENALLVCWGIPALQVEWWFAARVPSARIDWGGPVPLLGTFSYSARDNRSGWRYHSLIVPSWAVLTTTLAYPTIAFICGPFRRRRRRRRGECVPCGYNLTGNVSGVCPECGIEVETP